MELRRAKNGGGRESLKKVLAEYFGEDREIELYYKGREALESGFKRCGLKAGSRVAINGLTCLVVERSILRAGLKPVFTDLKKDSLNFGLEQLTAEYKKEKLSAIVLQNTLGYQMAELDEIIKFCRKEKIMIIEDMAHNFGVSYDLPSGKVKAGSLGDWGIVSLSRDKGWDVVSGGILIAKKGILGKKQNTTDGVSRSQQNKDRNYAWRTFLIRKFYGSVFGKVLHVYYKKRGLLLSPMVYAGDDKINQMNDWGAGVASEIWQSGEWKRTLEHRQNTANIYLENIDKKILMSTEKEINEGSCLRFPLLLKNEAERDELIKFLDDKGVFVSDIWYDANSAPKRLAHLSGYEKGSCPNAEITADRLLNLPTHMEVSGEDALRISGLVNEFINGGE